jgi:DNA invertase Pin-like site-specific DNA recombinase
MSRAAIYLRVSTDEQRESLDAQERGARAWCERTGAAVVAVYRDEGVSGAEWTRRAGVLDLRADAARSPRPWDVLVVRDLDRLGRDAIRLPELLSHLRDHEVRVLEWSTGHVVELDGMALIVAQLRAGLAQIERETIAHRVRTALKGKAERGLVVGGDVYGYARVRSPDGVRYVIDEAEAAVVREVFERHARGDGLREIGRSLNTRGVPSPRAGTRGTGTWSPSALHEITHRDRYLGVLRWGVTGSRYRQGTRVATVGRDVVEVCDESLRIIDDATWAAVRARDDSARVAADRPVVRRAARHLLVGHAVCDACGGPIATGRTKIGRVTVPAYLCGWRRDRGPEVCDARWSRPVARLDGLVLDWIARDVLTDELLRDVAAEAVRLAAAPIVDTRAAELRDEERALAAAVSRLTLAVETAPDVTEVVTRLRSQSERLRAVRGELATITTPAAPIDGLEARLLEGARRMRALLEVDTAGARDVLTLLLDGRLRVRWEGPRRPVWVSGAAVPGRVLTLGKEASPEGCGQSQRRVKLGRAA